MPPTTHRLCGGPPRGCDKRSSKRSRTHALGRALFRDYQHDRPQPSPLPCSTQTVPTSSGSLSKTQTHPRCLQARAVPTTTTRGTTPSRGPSPSPPATTSASTKQPAPARTDYSRARPLGLPLLPVLGWIGSEEPLTRHSHSHPTRRRLRPSSTPRRAFFSRNRAARCSTARS